MADAAFSPYSDPGNNVRVALNAAILAGDTSVVLKAPVAPYNKVPPLTRDNLNSSTANRPGVITLSNLAGTVIEVVTYTSVTDNADGTQTLGGLARGQEGTTAQAWNADDIAYQDVTAATLKKLNWLLSAFGYDDAAAATAAGKIYLRPALPAMYAYGYSACFGDGIINSNRSLMAGYGNSLSSTSDNSLANGQRHRVYGYECAVFGYGGKGYIRSALTVASNTYYDSYLTQATRVHRGDYTVDATTKSIPGSNRLTIMDNSVFGFTGTISAFQTGGTAGVVGEVKVWTVSGVIKNVAGTVAFVGTPTLTVLASDTNTTAWAVALVADDTNNALDVTFTGEANKTIAVSVMLDLVEAGNPAFAAIA